MHDNWSPKKDFDAFQTVNKIFRHIKQLTKKTLINKTSKKLLGLQFKWDNITKLKAIRFISKRYCLIIINNKDVLRQLQEIYCKRKFKCYKINKTD